MLFEESTKNAEIGTISDKHEIVLLHSTNVVGYSFLLKTNYLHEKTNDLHE